MLLFLKQADLANPAHKIFVQTARLVRVLLFSSFMTQ